MAPEAKGTPQGTPMFNVDFGKGGVVNLMEGLSPTELEELTGTKDDEDVEAKPNATLEGEEVVPEPEPEPEPAKEEPKDKVPEPEPAKAEPAPPVEPDAFEFKIKHRGQEKDLKLTREQLIAKLQMAEDYNVKTSELAETRRKLEPYLPIVERPEFNQWLSEQYEAGTFEKPKAPPPVPATDEYEFHRRNADPDFEAIRSEMRSYALTLPERAQALLASDYATFNREYDRFATNYRERKPAPAPVVTVDPKVQEKILQSKEKIKEKAAVEKPGTAPEETGEINWKRQEKELVKRMRAGDDNAAAELLLHRGIFNR